MAKPMPGRQLAIQFCCAIKYQRHEINALKLRSQNTAAILRQGQFVFLSLDWLINA